jgi:uncharacterized membrane protein YfcA
MNYPLTRREVSLLLPFLITGFVAGILSGLFGIGGGLVIVPALIYLFNLPQHTATGTSLVALLLPVGLLAVYEYYSSGKLTLENIKWGLLIAIGLFLGAFVGARIARYLPEAILRKSFAVILLFGAIKMWFQR